jgi:dolichyl-phosphate beta-glucosyltransferase
VNSLVLPTYNPGSSIVRTWAEVRAFLRLRSDAWEVLYVLDGCTDGTRELVSQLASESSDPRIRVLDYSPNRGKGHAVRHGLLTARGDCRIFTDVDLSFTLEGVGRIADQLQAGASVAIVSREHPESTITIPGELLGYAYRRRIKSHLFGRVVRALLPITTHDSQAGLKGMTASVAEQILPNLTCDGFGFDCELLTACARYNIPIQELPVHVRYDDASSTTRALTALRMLRELWKIRQRWATPGYPAAGKVSETPRIARAA